MPTPRLNPEGKETLDAILRRRPLLVRHDWETKIYQIITFIMQSRGVKEAGKDLVIEAAKFVTNPGFPFRRIENLQAARDRRSGWYLKKDVYYEAPRQVKRWESVPRKPLKPPGEMKVLAVNASPRYRGNTDVLIDEALRGASDAGARIEKLMLQKLNIKYCIGCRKCKESGYERICALKDDMSDLVYRKILDADVIIIGFPVYTGREPAQLATFFDRLDCFHRSMEEAQSDPARLITPGEKTAMIIGTWGARDTIKYDHVVERIIILTNGHKIEPVEAISAGGFSGMLHGLMMTTRL